MTIHHDLVEDAGAPGVTLRLAEAYRARGHLVDVIGFELLPQRSRELVKAARFPWALAPVLLNRARAGIDVIDASTGDAWVYAAMRRLARSRSGPLLVTRSHGLEHTARAALMREVDRGDARVSRRYHLYHGGFRLREVAWSLRSADMSLVLNRADRAYAVEHLGVPEASVHVVPNGLNAALLGLPAPRPESDGGPLRVAHIGTWLARKGINVLVPAITQFLSDDPAAAMTFVGTGRSQDEVLGAFPRSVRAQIQVVPRFRNADLPVLLAGHQIKVLGSISEGFPGALLEAMACGLAPISTATAGAREIIDDGVNGILVPVGEPQGLVAALRSLALDRRLLGPLRRAAHETAQHYSWARIADAQVAMYEQAIGARAAAAG